MKSEFDIKIRLKACEEVFEKLQIKVAPPYLVTMIRYLRHENLLLYEAVVNL